MKARKILIIDHRTYCINSLGDSLAQMGHELAFQSSWIRDEVELGISLFKPDILITVGFNHRLFSSFADSIPLWCKKYNLLHLYWATEDLINHMDWSLPYVQRTRPDLVWTIHPDCIQKYQSLGFPAGHLNFGFNPRIFPGKGADEKELYNICFVGATHIFKRTYRFRSFQQLLFPLVKAGIKTDVWGLGWQKETAKIKEYFGHTVPEKWLHGYLLYGESAWVYRSSKIVLGVQNAQDQVTQRTFEILGSGAFMLASRTPALMGMFRDKEDLVLTSSGQETLELVDYYLDRPRLRYEIGQNARRKVLDNYTYQQSLRKIWPQAEALLEGKRTGRVKYEA